MNSLALSLSTRLPKHKAHRLVHPHHKAQDRHRNSAGNTHSETSQCQNQFFKTLCPHKDQINWCSHIPHIDVVPKDQTFSTFYSCTPVNSPLKEREALSQTQCPRLFLTKQGDLGRGSSLSKFRHGTLTVEVLINSRPLYKGAEHPGDVNTDLASLPKPQNSHSFAPLHSLVQRQQHMGLKRMNKTTTPHPSAQKRWTALLSDPS